MKHTHLKLFFLALAISQYTYAQYTDIINSNRPGRSVSAYAPGTNVYQAEIGGFYERRKHNGLLTEHHRYGTDFAIRMGVLDEKLELTWQGTYMWDQVTYNTTVTPYTVKHRNFYDNTLGAKYLIFEPKHRKPNLYSWRANYKAFHWEDLIPAISVYIGANLLFGDNPYFPQDPNISLKTMLITQSHFAGSWVLTTNISYDKLGADDTMFTYILTLTHALNDPRYSVFAEHQGFKSDAYGDGIFRLGAARLINSSLQVDASAGINIKNTPSRLFAGIGLSYRVDYHVDELVPAPLEEDSRKKERDENGNPVGPELLDHQAGRKMKYEKAERKKKKKARKKRRKKENPFDID